MASKHHLSHASQLYVGDAYTPVAFATNERHGVPISFLTKVSLGSPIAASATGIVSAATSTEMPNATTKTYTPATDNTTPLDGAIAAPSTIAMGDGQAVLVWSLDVPRNLSLNVTHSSSIVACTCTVTGYDQYKQKMVETMTITATGTDKTAAGLKAFKYVSSIAITSAGNSTTNTLNLGWGDALGLPYVISAKSDVMQTWFNSVKEATEATIVVAVTATATATTGDVRGTVDLNSAMNGSTVEVWGSFDLSTFGVSQYAG